MEAQSWQTWRFGNRAWQNEAWRLYDLTGPLRYVANWAGNSASRARLYVAKAGPDGEAGEETKNPQIAALAAGPLGTGPAKAEAIRVAVINLVVPGEVYVVAEADSGPDGEDRWWITPGRLIRRSGRDITIRRPQGLGGGDMIYRPDVDLIIRVHTPHPADPDEADSPARSALPDLREIEAIRKREFAELDSRLAGAGLLPLPEDIDFPPPPDQPDNPGGVVGLQMMLMKAMATSLADRSSAAAMVPIMFRVKSEHLDKIKPVHFWSELSDQLPVLREAAIRGLAQSLDVPPEILLGQADSNHWTSWQIASEAVNIQIVPLLARLADALTAGWLKAALEDMGEDPDGHVYAFDVAALTAKPDRTDDAAKYHEDGLLSDLAAVVAAGWDEEHMPSDAERIRRLIEKIVVTNPMLLANEAIQQILGITVPIVIETAPPPAPAPVEGDQPPPDDGSGGPKQIPDRPSQPPEDDGQPPVSAAIHAVSDLAMRRAMALAGVKLIPRPQRASLSDVPRHQLNVRYGPASPTQAEAALEGAWDDLIDVARSLSIDPYALKDLLHGFAVELLTRGMGYTPDLLHDLVDVAVRGRRLEAKLEVAR